MKILKRIKKEFPNNKIKFTKNRQSTNIIEWNIIVDDKKLKITFKDISKLFKIKDSDFYGIQEEHLNSIIEKIKEELLKSEITKDLQERAKIKK